MILFCYLMITEPAQLAMFACSCREMVTKHEEDGWIILKKTSLDTDSH